MEPRPAAVLAIAGLLLVILSVAVASPTPARSLPSVASPVAGSEQYDDAPLVLSSSKAGPMPRK